MLECTKLSNQCKTYTNLGIACSHLIYTRKLNNEDLLDSAMFQKHWLLFNDDDCNLDPPAAKKKCPTPLSGKTLKLSKTI